MGGRMGGYGGMGGGYGGMGGMGMGGMGMGGMGMGGMGMGGMGMGGMGIDYNREYREQLLLQLIELTIEPESWESYGMGGQGMITPYQGKKLAIFQTPEIHKQIEELFSQMREALGHQVSIESRFLIVAESFLEDIGLDVDFRIRPGGKWALIDISQEHSEAVAPSTTRVPGSLGGTIRGMEVEGGYGTVFDDLQVHFLLRALEAYTDAKALTAPLVTVVSGEMAMMQVMTDTVIALPPAVGSIDITAGVSGITSQQQFIPQLATVNSGTTLTVTPVITRDKKHVVLNITTMLNEFLGLKEYNLETPLPDGTIAEFTQSLPETEMSTVSTQVTVPDGGTLLLGGQKVRVEVEKEAGVPILGKVPVLGRLFRNRSTVRDTRTLLILVKPTIILQEERDAEAYGRLEPVL
jgi:general secretion pathway protein D